MNKKEKASHVINATAGITTIVLNLKEHNLFFKRKKQQHGIAVDAVERKRTEEKVLPRSKYM